MQSFLDTFRDLAEENYSFTVLAYCLLATSFMAGVRFGLKLQLRPVTPNPVAERASDRRHPFEPTRFGSALIGGMLISPLLTQTHRNDCWLLLGIWAGSGLAGTVTAYAVFPWWLRKLPTEFVRKLSVGMARHGWRSDGLALFEKHLGLAADTYFQLDFAARLDAALARLPQEACTAAVLGLAELLGFIGRASAGANLLATYLGLSSNPPSDRLIEQICARCRDLPRDLSDELYQELAEQLYALGKHRLALRLTAACLGLTLEDWKDRKRFGVKLAEAFRDRRPFVKTTFITLLTRGGHIEECRGNETLPIEACLGLSAGDYTRVDVQQEVCARLGGLSSDESLLLGILLLAVLEGTNRTLEARAFFRCFLSSRGIEGQAAVRRLIEHLPRRARLSAVPMLAAMLTEEGHADHAANLLELELGLKLAEVGDSHKLHEALYEVGSAIAFSYIIQWQIALAATGMPGDGLRLVESWFHMSDGGFPQSAQNDAALARLRDILNLYRRDVAPETMIQFIHRTARLYFQVGKPEQALLLLFACLGITPEDFATGEPFTGKLQDAFTGVSPTTAAFYMLEVMRHFIAGGIEEPATLVFLSWLTFFFDINAGRPKGGQVVDPLVLSEIFALWMDHFATRDLMLTINICACLEPLLRQDLAETGVHREDRRSFQDHTTHLRQAIVDVGSLLAEQSADWHTRSAILLQTYLWEAELKQRLLIDRFLFEDVAPGEQDGSATMLQWDRLPFFDDDVVDADGAAAELGVLQRTSDEASASALPGAASRLLPERRPAWFAPAERIVREGLTVQGVAAALGDDTILLRVSFTPHGQLRWVAFRSDGATLAVVGHGKGLRDDADLRALRSATAWHDLALALLWHGRRDACLYDDLRALLTELSSRCRAWQRDTAEPDVAAFERCLALFFARLEASAGAQEARIAFEAELASLGPIPLTLGDRAAWAGESRERFKRLAHLLEEMALSPKDGVRSLLDRWTQVFLNEVQQVLCLSSLAAALDEDTDLVVQAEDVLHSVPFAYLNLDGTHLFTRVRSISNTPSPLFTMLQRMAEMDGSASTSDNEDYLLTVSWFDPHDPDRRALLCATRHLHEGQAAMAREYGIRYFGAAETPRGERLILAAGLRQPGRCLVATVCGHGHRRESGIALADGVWKGEGCLLDATDFLIFVSCSIGRLKHSVGGDVEGFCIELAIRRARSVLSCRWPVIGDDAVSFAHQVLTAYLNLRRQCGHGTTPHRFRAWAVNLARRVIRDSPGGTVGLNTAASFEFFGLQ